MRQASRTSEHSEETQVNISINKRRSSTKIENESEDFELSMNKSVPHKTVTENEFNRIAKKQQEKFGTEMLERTIFVVRPIIVNAADGKPISQNMMMQSISD